MNRMKTTPSLKFDGLKNRLTKDDTIEGRGIVLWNPIAISTHSRLGLYSDSRFPGRCILALNAPYTALEDVPVGTLTGFMRDVQVASAAIKKATDAERVNVSILGNREPFIHAHLIPRFPADERYPDRSPWDDPRIKQVLPKDRAAELINRIWHAILETDTRKQGTKSQPLEHDAPLPGLDRFSIDTHRQ